MVTGDITVDAMCKYFEEVGMKEMD